MKRLIIGALLTSLLVLAAAVPAAADPATTVDFVAVFDDVNPCTDEIHTVTIAVTAYEHLHDGRVHGVGERTISTSSGFVGHGRDMLVDNGRVFMFRLADILANDSGDRIRARFVLVIDLSTGTARVETGELSCLGA